MKRSSKWFLMAAAALTFPMVGATSFAEDDPAAAMAALGDQLAMDNPEGGGSIRAKKDPDTKAAQRKASPDNLQARVVSLKKGAFPQVGLVLKVLKPATKGAGKDIAKDAQLIVTPTYKFAGKAADLSDEATTLNAGAYYLAEGDTVFVRLDAKTGNVWKASYVERR